MITNKTNLAATADLLTKKLGLGPMKFDLFTHNYYPKGTHPDEGGSPVEMLHDFYGETLVPADFEAFSNENCPIPVLLFISRHKPTTKQHQLAFESGRALVHFGDVDPLSPDLLNQLGEFCGKFEATPLIATSNAALSAILVTNHYDVAYFVNSKREDGEFDTSQMIVISAQGDDPHLTHTMTTIQL